MSLCKGFGCSLRFSLLIWGSVWNFRSCLDKLKLSGDLQPVGYIFECWRVCFRFLGEIFIMW